MMIGGLSTPAITRSRCATVSGTVSVVIGEGSARRASTCTSKSRVARRENAVTPALVVGDPILPAAWCHPESVNLDDGVRVGRIGAHGVVLPLLVFRKHRGPGPRRTNHRRRRDQDVFMIGEDPSGRVDASSPIMKPAVKGPATRPLSRHCRVLRPQQPCEAAQRRPQLGPISHASPVVNHLPEAHQRVPYAAGLREHGEQPGRGKTEDKRRAPCASKSDGRHELIIGAVGLTGRDRDPPGDVGQTRVASATPPRPSSPL